MGPVKNVDTFNQSHITHVSAINQGTTSIEPLKYIKVAPYSK